MMSRVIHIRISEEMEQRLQKRIKDLGLRSMTEVCNYVFATYFDTNVNK